jgi:hypothetical protein
MPRTSFLIRSRSALAAARLLAARRRGRDRSGAGRDIGDVHCDRPAAGPRQRRAGDPPAAQHGLCRPVGICQATRTAYRTTAYNAGTGAARWSQRYGGPAGYNDNVPAALGISPDGRAVYVTGTSDNPTSRTDYATIAYRIATGTRLWVSRFTGLGNTVDQAHALAVNPNGNAVYVTGSSWVPQGGSDFATVAYRTG